MFQFTSHIQLRFLLFISLVNLVVNIDFCIETIEICSSKISFRYSSFFKLNYTIALLLYVYIGLGASTMFSFFYKKKSIRKQTNEHSWFSNLFLKVDAAILSIYKDKNISHNGINNRKKQ